MQAVEGEDADIYSSETFLAFLENSISDQMHALRMRREREPLLPRHGTLDCQ
jgi:hypothetical protein